MCGLVGVVLKSMGGGISADLALFSDLLYMDALRGFDSTGVATYHNNGDVFLAKEAVEATWYMASDGYKKLGKEFIKNGKAIIGHNRKSTVGKTVDVTAHPFHIEHENKDFVFMHNGTLRNHEKIAKTEVDSEALGMLLCPLGDDPRAMEKALEQVDGAYACMWIDQEKGKLYLLRNKERPLYISLNTFGYVIASEYGFIAAAQLRNRVEMKDVSMVEEDTLYCIDMNNYEAAIKKEKLTVKKAPALLIPTRTKGSTVSANRVTFEGEVSKNSFKRIRKTYIGTTCAFWLADYKPSGDGSPINSSKECLKWNVWGDDEENIEFEHQFRGVMENMTEDEMLWVCEAVPLVGRVEDVTYQASTKSVLFHMGKVQLQAASITHEAVH